MPPRPYSLLRSIASSPALRLSSRSSPHSGHSCLRRTIPAPPRRIQGSHFHATTPRYADALVNHYETLHLTSTASASEIKRQFYTLSKKNHPDHNRNDPEASTRFVAISEAYHVLSVPEKRAKYDAQLEHSQRQSRWTQSANEYPQGSYSSAAYGSRPASGLNKKRSTFRGPPPSFYKAGGYGCHGAKRAEYAYSSAHEGGEADKGAGQESYGEWGGFGPGQQKQGNQVPHFDDIRHKETQDNVHDHIWSRRKKLRMNGIKVEEEWEKGNMVVNFLAVSTVIALIGITAKLFENRHEASQRRTKEST